MGNYLVSVGLGFLGLVGLFFIPNGWIKILCIVAAGIFFYHAAALLWPQVPPVYEIVTYWKKVLHDAF